MSHVPSPAEPPVEPLVIHLHERPEARAARRAPARWPRIGAGLVVLGSVAVSVLRLVAM